MNTTDLLYGIQRFTNSETIHMYIIERKKKPDSTIKSKPSDKYEYVPLQINLSPELTSIVSNMLSQTIAMIITNKTDLDLREYQVIDDNEDKIYTYADLDRISGFKTFLKDKLGTEISSLDNFEELTGLEKAWAICYGFYFNEEWLYCIKKLTPSKIAIDTSLSSSITEATKNGINSIFDLTTKTLKPFTGFTLNIEPSIDLIYYKENLYVFHKKAFEELTSLTDEFVNIAMEIVEEIKDFNFIDGFDSISNVITEKPSQRKRLIKAREIGNIEFLKKCKDIKKEFLRTGKRLKIKFEFDEQGRIIANDEVGADNIIKVLCEYYKEGVFGKKIFESPAGRLRE